jgi:predicted nuclease of predicted toxin-antitoxin system
MLFDENLSPRLPALLAGVFPGSVHVRDVGLKAADDGAVWAHAAANGLAVVTKDADFRHRSFLFGAPPKVVAICLGNCATTRVEALLRAREADGRAFLADPRAALLVLS